MENETNTKKRPARRSNNAKAAGATATVKEASVETDTCKASAGVSSDAKRKTSVRSVVNFAPTDYVVVRNGFQGRLVFTSRRTGERYVWDEFGDEQEMQISELKSAKSSNKRFFEQNWFMIEDPDVISYLGVNNYYKDALSIDDFETLFDDSVDDVIDRVAALSEGQKRSVYYVARRKIADGSIDSRQMISALEDVLGVALTDR